MLDLLGAPGLLIHNPRVDTEGLPQEHAGRVSHVIRGAQPRVQLRVERLQRSTDGSHVAALLRNLCLLRHRRAELDELAYGILVGGVHALQP